MGNDKVPSPRVEWGEPETLGAPARGKAFPLYLGGFYSSECAPKSTHLTVGRKLPAPGNWCLLGPVPLDRYTSALEQVPPMIAEHPLTAWSDALGGEQPAQSRAGQELATLLLAINYELLGYSPEHAWLLAQRGEEAAPGRLDG